MASYDLEGLANLVIGILAAQKRAYRRHITSEVVALAVL